uniref:Uncharacterized protein n=1 Tax=uncultured Alphaproteobacteria bacterium TaxID=91750 RepID=A0A6G8F2E0_9PROT|nr:hypothetical protein PlAlph_3770 [uncultured Alphaproteobacteria bacterium]
MLTRLSLESLLLRNKTMPNENFIESIVYFGSQSVTGQIIYQLNGRTIKLEIKSDSFAVQSYAKVCVFDGTVWNDLYAILYSLMQTPHELFYSPRFCGRDYKNLTGAAQSCFTIKL